MRKGVFGFDIWFYGVVALLLAACRHVVPLGGLILFVFLMEKDEWLNRQLMQALLMCLGCMAIHTVLGYLSSVLVLVPFFGWLLHSSFLLLVDAALQLFMILFGLRAADRMHKGLDSDIPIVAAFVNRMF